MQRGLALVSLFVASCIPAELDSNIYASGRFLCPPAPLAPQAVPDRGAFAHVLEGISSTQTLRYEGRDWDDTLLIGCRVQLAAGAAIELKDVRNFWVVGCFVQATGAGVTVVGSPGVVIRENHIRDVRGIGISVEVDPASGATSRGARIEGNRIERAAGGAVSVSGIDLALVGNIACDDSASFAVSFSGTGTVARNRIVAAQLSGMLVSTSARALLENNMIDALADALFVSAGTVELRFNTLLSSLEPFHTLRAHGPEVRSWANIFAHRSTDRPIEGQFVDEGGSFLQRGLDGFAGPTRPFDLHLTTEHEALSTAAGIASHPDFDIDGEPRALARLDPGADQRTR
ncbi:MAG: right-handed parallel beta-helix repeat-containing protein [Deltaproteobacteria bacterium]|nr:right-handed parallel beta-helix repeat-containing protein [Deltaproteobacteria bacterium]